MKLVRFQTAEGQIQWGQETGHNLAIPLTGDLYGTLEPSGKAEHIFQQLAPLVPSSIFGIGLNYRQHATESGMDFPKRPIVFMKPISAVADPDQPIEIPSCCDPGGEVDYECELAVVIGRSAKNVRVEHALEHVLGYTAANDVSARNWQLQQGGGQWSRGKSFDTFCPLGPCLVTADEIPYPQSLRISTTLNGQVVQEHSTNDMIFCVAEIISFLSQGTTLLPGTVILTGTPQGVGFARKPPVFLQDGDVVTVEIEKIGKLTNVVKAL